MKFQYNAFARAWRASWLMGALMALPSWAVEPFALKDIRVEGLQRIEPGTDLKSVV
jgi:outer membrane protein insertion porin family